MLSPFNERPKTFAIGSREYDPVNLGYRIDETITNASAFDTRIRGNYNRGHEFTDEKRNDVIGPKLTPDERKALIEFIKRSSSGRAGDAPRRSYSVFERSMPSDLIRGVDTGWREESASKQKGEPGLIQSEPVRPGHTEGPIPGTSTVCGRGRLATSGARHNISFVCDSAEIQYRLPISIAPRSRLTDPEAPHAAREASTVQFPPTVVPTYDGLLDRVVKIVGVSDNHPLVEQCEAAVQRQFGANVSAARSQPHYLDVTHPTANKGVVAERLSHYYKIPLEQLATVGDQPNDVLMFRAAA